MLGFFWIQTGTKAEKLSKTLLDFSHTCLFLCFLCYVTIADIYWELTMGKVLHVSFTSFISLQRLGEACMMNILLWRKLRLEEKLLNLLNLRELVMSKNVKSWAQVCLTLNYYIVLLHILSLGLFCLEKNKKQKTNPQAMFYSYLLSYILVEEIGWYISDTEKALPLQTSALHPTPLSPRDVFSFPPLGHLIIFSLL